MENAMKSPLVVPLWPKGSPNAKGGDATMPGGEPSLVLHQPPIHGQLKKPRPCVLICPGGGYGIRAEHEGTPFAHLFGQLGMVSGVIHYRVKPNLHPAPFADAARAVRLARANAEAWNIEPSRIAIMGFSAGGHLASTVAVQPELCKDPEDDLAAKFSARPDRLILGYPVVSAVSGSHGGSFVNLLGEDGAKDEKLRAQVSNELHVAKDAPPAFIFHTANDPVVPVQNSLNLARAYADAGVSCELHVYKDGPHGVGMALHIPKLKSWTEFLSVWMQDWVRPPYGD